MAASKGVPVAGVAHESRDFESLKFIQHMIVDQYHVRMLLSIYVA